MEYFTKIKGVVISVDIDNHLWILQGKYNNKIITRSVDFKYDVNEEVDRLISDIRNMKIKGLK